MDPEIPSTPPSRSLKGKVAIVTGAGCFGTGIGNGRAISILLASDECSVVCVDLKLEWATQTVDMILAGHGLALPFQADVTSAENCQAAVRFAIERFGRLDILVNNVGVAGAVGTAVDVDMEQWARGMEINVASMVQMSKYAIPEMVKNESEMKGNIVNNMLTQICGLR